MVIWLWLGFLALIATLVALDLRFARRRARYASPAASIAWTVGWIACTMLVGGGISALYDRNWAGLGLDRTDLAGHPHHVMGEGAFMRFITAYLMEAALSLDNLFIIALIFAYFRFKPSHRHLVLFTGVMIAIPIRGLLLGAGITLIELARWTTYLFGAALLLSALKMATLRTDNPDPDSNPAIRLVRRLYPVSTIYEGRKFFTRLPPPTVERPAPATWAVRGRIAMTPLMIALLMVESADAIYALGSMPAVLTVTRDPFLVFSSNVMAVLTVRSMYPALAGVLHRFTYIKAALVFLLLYAAMKMLLAHHVAFPTVVTLSVIVGLLCIGAVASFLADTPSLRPPLGTEVEYYAKLTVRQAHRLIVLVVGLTFVALSVPIGFLLPGPTGLPLLILGLVILATEFVWAKHLLRRARNSAVEAERRLGVLAKLRQARAWCARRLRLGRG